MKDDTRTDRVAKLPSRDRFIPVRKEDILDALIDHGAILGEGRRQQFRELCRMLAAIFHYEYFTQLEKLRHAYFYFDPQLDEPPALSAVALENAYAELMAALSGVLEDANFAEVPQEDIARAHREAAASPVATKTPLGDFRLVRFFHRGQHQRSLSIKRWFWQSEQKIETEVYDDVVMFAALKPDAEIVSRRERKRLSARHLRPGSVLIKYFRNIARADLNALYPNARVVLTTWDKLILAVPAIAGGIPILLSLSSTVTVLFLVIGFYLGVSAEVEDSEMKKALAALSGLVALGGFIMRQWVKYQRQSLAHQVAITNNVYYRNINNNAGIFDYLIGAAEDQECKETFLAYYFLSTAQEAIDEAALKERIERWLKEMFSVDVEFRGAEALSKLDRLELLHRDGAALSVLRPQEALARLDVVWDDFFPASNIAAMAEGASETPGASAVQ
jgi:hypothetical protein